MEVSKMVFFGEIGTEIIYNASFGEHNIHSWSNQRDSVNVSISKLVIKEDGGDDADTDVVPDVTVDVAVDVAVDVVEVCKEDRLS